MAKYKFQGQDIFLDEVPVGNKLDWNWLRLQTLFHILKTVHIPTLYNDYVDFYMSICWNDIRHNKKYQEQLIKLRNDVDKIIQEADPKDRAMVVQSAEHDFRKKHFILINQTIAQKGLIPGNSIVDEV